MNLVLAILPLAQEGAERGTLINFLILPILFIVMYFLILRPQKKEEQNRKKMISELTKGDTVLLNSGMYGKIVEFKDNNETVVINVGKETQISFTSSSILKKIVK